MWLPLQPLRSLHRSSPSELCGSFSVEAVGPLRLLSVKAARIWTHSDRLGEWILGHFATIERQPTEPRSTDTTNVSVSKEHELWYTGIGSPENDFSPICVLGYITLYLTFQPYNDDDKWCVQVYCLLVIGWVYDANVLLPHWSINPKTPDMTTHLVTFYWHRDNQSYFPLYPINIKCPSGGSNRHHDHNRSLAGSPDHEDQSTAYLLPLHSMVQHNKNI